MRCTSLVRAEDNSDGDDDTNASAADGGEDEISLAVMRMMEGNGSDNEINR